MISRSKFQTQKFAAKLAKTLFLERSPVLHSGGIRAKKILRFAPYAPRAKVIALRGDLGAGKTTFVRGFIKALGVKHHVTSPTFLIIRKYQIKIGRTSLKLRSKYLEVRPLEIDFKYVYHLDLYRIHKLKELLDLGFKKIINPPADGPQNIVLIEWPERVKKLLPQNMIWIIMEHRKKKNERIINIR